MQLLDPVRTPWHITFGTYATRLHGDERPTVDRAHNQRGTPFLAPDPDRVALERGLTIHPPTYLLREQCEYVESLLPGLCERGGWTYRVGAAARDHVHVLCDVAREVHGERVRMWLKRWLTEALNERWPQHRDRPWWIRGGSNKPVKDGAYLNNAYAYILRQRCTPADESGRSEASRVGSQSPPQQPRSP